MTTASSFNEDAPTTADSVQQPQDSPRPPFVVGTLLHGSSACVSLVAEIGSRHELTADEWLILDALADSAGLSMSQIAEQSLSSGATLTRTVDRLVSRSLVYREVGHTDRRKVLVFLSPLGQARHSAMSSDIADAEVVVRSRLTAAGVDPDVLARVLPEIWMPPSTR